MEKIQTILACATILNFAMGYLIINELRKIRRILKKNKKESPGEEDEKKE